MRVDYFWQRVFSLGVLVLGTLLVWLWPVLAATGGQIGLLTVSFLDVGQGDAIFIEGPNGTQVLIDGGPDAAVLRQLAAAMPYFDRSLDMMVATHPDADHISGLVDVLDRYQVGQILMTENENETATDNAFRTRVANEAVPITMARRGQVWDLGAGAKLEILWPETNPKDLESNTSSIVAQLSYGAATFMLTGDAPKSIEEYLVLTDGEHLKSTVLKLGHHGSRTSTSELWLEEVAPQFAVISSGQDNRYGHPHLEVTDALFNHRIEALNTAAVGTITFKSDGTKLWREE